MLSNSTIMQIWEYYKELYIKCKNNQEFLFLIENNKNKELSDTKNKDLIINYNDSLVTQFQNNQLITIRLGSVESRFLINNYFHKIFCTEDYPKDDSQMKSNAGMYYTNPQDKENINSWWIDNTIDLLKNKNTTHLPCFLCLHYDLYILSLLDIKNKIIDTYIRQSELIEYFYNRNIIVISNGIEDMEKSYNLGLQRLYNIPIQEEKIRISFIKCPQTTTGMSVPHKHMKETTEEIMNLIEKQYHNFDTILFCCGGYSSVLINLLSKKYNNKNLLYFGSELYTLFGLYSNGIEKPNNRQQLFNVSNFLEISSPCPPACKNIDNGKYWK